MSGPLIETSIELDGGRLTFALYPEGHAAAFDMRSGPRTSVVDGQPVMLAQTICTNLTRAGAVQLYRLLADWLAVDDEDLDSIHEPSYIKGIEAEQDRMRAVLGL